MGFVMYTEFHSWFAYVEISPRNWVTKIFSVW